MLLREAKSLVWLSRAGMMIAVIHTHIVVKRCAHPRKKSNAFLSRRHGSKWHCSSAALGANSANGLVANGVASAALAV